jgi:DeoR family transcriptional regulator, aga operon transcriptional repressor
VAPIQWQASPKRCSCARKAELMSDRQQRRTDKILKLLLHKGTVSVGELIASLDASAPSIRRDLTRLEAQGLIRRTRGGAALVQELLYEPFRYDAAFQTRQHLFVKEKRHIGVAAAELIEENETIGLTAGTTTTWVARCMRHRSNITVVTNAVNIGMELCNMPGLKIHLTGGYVRWPWSFSLIGAAAVNFLGDIFLDKVFLGVSGIDAERGTTTNESDEALSFRAMVKQAKKVIVVADSSKLGVVTSSLICPIADVDVLVTDEGASEEMCAGFSRKGIKVIRV